jgi:hypothetical protein
LIGLRLLGFTGCSNWQVTDGRLGQHWIWLGNDRPVERIQVTKTEDADRLVLRGSPTVLIEGQDPFAGLDAPRGLSCRDFTTSDGRRGAPTVRRATGSSAPAAGPPR